MCADARFLGPKTARQKGGESGANPLGGRCGRIDTALSEEEFMASITQTGASLTKMDAATASNGRASISSSGCMALLSGGGSSEAVPRMREGGAGGGRLTATAGVARCVGTAGDGGAAAVGRVAIRRCRCTSCGPVIRVGPRKTRCRVGSTFPGGTFTRWASIEGLRRSCSVPPPPALSWRNVHAVGATSRCPSRGERQRYQRVPAFRPRRPPTPANRIHRDSLVSGRTIVWAALPSLLWALILAIHPARCSVTTVRGLVRGQPDHSDL